MSYTTKDGIVRTPDHIEAAFEACRRLELAYARASEDNGGGSSIDWADIDRAREKANLAITDKECLAIEEQACAENEGVYDEPTYEFKLPEDTEGGACD
jgi:hypothetical protein